MINPILEKAIAILLILLVPSTFLFSQTSPEELFEKPEPVKSEYTMLNGMQDGERDATGNPAYACGGAACGVIDFVFAAISDPKPPATVMLAMKEHKGEAYAVGLKWATPRKPRTET